MFVDEFQTGHHADNDTGGKGAPDTELGSAHLYVEPAGVDAHRVLCDILASCLSTGLEASRHVSTETHEAQGDEEGRYDGHKEHQSGEEDVQEETQEFRLLLFVGQSWEAIDLDETDQEYKECSDEGEITVGGIGGYDVVQAV